MNVEYDKFYTKPEIAKQCIEMLDLNAYDEIVEPSAGNGAFSKLIPGIMAYDLVPEDDSIIQQDFFEFDSSQISGKCLVLGNPAYGTNNRLAVRFFNKAAEFANTIAFILPKSFKKDSIKDRLNPYMHLVKEIDLPKKSFHVDGEEYDVPSVHQIWVRRDFKRSKSKKVKPKGFCFVKKDAETDMTVRRVGSRAGAATDEHDVARSIHNFISLDDKSIADQVISEMNEVEWEHNNTVAQKSISQSEIAAVLNNIIEKLTSKIRKVRKWSFHPHRWFQEKYGKVKSGIICIDSKSTEVQKSYSFYKYLKKKSSCNKNTGFS